MGQTMRFGEVLDAADQLSPEEQETLVEILQRRLAQNSRKKLAEEIQEARQQFNEGRCQPTTPDELLKEILS